MDCINNHVKRGQNGGVIMISDFPLYQKSMISHLDVRLNRLSDRFVANPFRFFSEREIHFHFTEDLYKLVHPREGDEKWRGGEIIREFATDTLYRRDSSGALVEDGDGGPGFIDVVLRHPSLTIGFEFYLAKQTHPCYVDVGFRKYRLKHPSFSLKKALTHAHNDWKKLHNQKDLDLCYMVCFIAGFSESIVAREKWERDKRSELCKELETLSQHGDDRFWIIYREGFKVRGLKEKHPGFRAQWGR